MAFILHEVGRPGTAAGQELRRGDEIVRQPRPGDVAASTPRPGDVAASAPRPGDIAASTPRPGDILTDAAGNRVGKEITKAASGLGGVTATHDADQGGPALTPNVIAESIGNIR